MPLRTYGSYKAAEQSVRLLQLRSGTFAPECRVWGFDPRAARRAGSKSFCSGARTTFLQFILAADQPEPHFYETITADSHARFMIDMDMHLVISEAALVQNEVALGSHFVGLARKIVRRFEQARKTGSNEINSPTSTVARHMLVQARKAALAVILEHMCWLLGTSHTAMYALDASCVEIGKFSLHVHFPELVLGGHHIDGAILGCSLAASVNLWILHYIRERLIGGRDHNGAAPDTSFLEEPTVLAAVLMWPWNAPPQHASELGRFGVVDTSVYSRFRLMRMPLQTKRGKGRPLIPVCAEQGTLLCVPDSVAERVSMFEKHFEIVPPHEVLCKHKALHLFPSHECEGLYLGASSKRALKDRALHTDDQALFLHAPMYWGERMNLFLHSRIISPRREDAFLLQQRGDSQVAGRMKRVTPGLPALKVDGENAKEAKQYCRSGSESSSKGEILVLPAVVYDENGHPLQTTDLIGTNGCLLHCPICDTSDGKSVRSTRYSSNRQYEGPDGDPCAKTFTTARNETMAYCFSCQSCYMIMDGTQESMGFCGGDLDDATIIEYDSGSTKYFPVDRLVESGLPYLRAWNRARSRAERSSSMFEKNVFNQGKHNENTPAPHYIAVNAGMGSGKTQAAVDFSRHSEVRCGTVVVCYRRALLRELSSRFGVPYYLDNDTFEIWADKGSVAICINSLPRLRKYDRPLVVIDEAGFVRRSFVGETFRSVDHRRLCLRALGRLLSSSAVVLLLQHGLSEADVDFYVDVERLYGGRSSAIYEQPAQSPSVQKYFFRMPLSEGRYHLTTHIRLWLLALRQTITAGKKTFMPCSQRRTAEALALFVVHCCRPKAYESCETWREKVALVTGHSKSMLPRGHFESSEDYVEKYKSYDVAIATCSLETGVSLTDHYTAVFGMYRTFPIPHAAQVQLTNRVRNSEMSIIYAERGKRGALASDPKYLRRLFNLGSIDAEDSIIAETMAQVTAESAETYNSNDLIWRHREMAIPLTVANFQTSIQPGSAAPDTSKIAVQVDYEERLGEDDENSERHPLQLEQEVTLEEELKEVARQYWDFAKQHEKGIQRYLCSPETDEALEGLIESAGCSTREVLTHLCVSGALHARMGLRDILTYPAFEAVALLERVENILTHKDDANGNVYKIPEENLSKIPALVTERSWRAPRNLNRIAIIKMYFIYVDHFAQVLCGEGEPSDSTWSRLIQTVPTFRSMTPLVLRTRENVAWVQLGLFMAERVFGCVLPLYPESRFYAVPEAKIESLRRALCKSYSTPCFSDANVSKHVQRLCKKSGGLTRRTLAREIRKWTPIRVVCRTKHQGKLTEKGFAVGRLPSSTALMVCADPERTMCMMDGDCTWRFFETEIASLRSRLGRLQLLCTGNVTSRTAGDLEGLGLSEASGNSQDLQRLAHSRVPEAIEGFMGKLESLAKYLNKC
jgi:hypothetical protein